LFFALVHHVVPLCLQQPKAQQFPAAWAGCTSQCSAYLSLMSMNGCRKSKFYDSCPKKNLKSKNKIENVLLSSNPRRMIYRQQYLFTKIGSFLKYLPTWVGIRQTH